MKSSSPTKVHKVLSVAFWFWLLLALVAPFLPYASLIHNLLTYAPPLAICLPGFSAMVLVILRAILRRSKRLDLVNFVAGLVSTFLIVGFQIPLPIGSPLGQRIRVLTTNIEFHNRDVPGLKEYIRGQKVDLVMMQEVKGDAKSAVAMLKREFPDWSFAAVGEVAILSRWPLSDITKTPLRSLPGRFLLSAKVNSPKPFRAMTTHWSVPQISKGFNALNYTIQSQIHDFEDTNEVIQNEPLSTILGGDLNNPPRQGLSRMMSDRMEDAFSSRGLGTGWTYPAHRPMVRIDHLFSNKSIKPVQALVGPSFGSDHRSLFAEFVME